MQNIWTQNTFAKKVLRKFWKQNPERAKKVSALGWENVLTEQKTFIATGLGMDGFLFMDDKHADPK